MDVSERDIVKPFCRQRPGIHRQVAAVWVLRVGVQHQNLVGAAVLRPDFGQLLRQLQNLLGVPAVVGYDGLVGRQRHPAHTRRRKVEAAAPLNFLVGTVFGLRVVIAGNRHKHRPLQPVDDGVDVAQLLHPQLLAV